MNAHFFACLLCSSGCETNHLILVPLETFGYFSPSTLNVWETLRFSDADIIAAVGNCNEV